MINFSKYTDKELNDLYSELFGEYMPNNCNLLRDEELAEAHSNWITNEKELSEEFDSVVNEHGKILLHDGSLDVPAMQEWFNDWTDSLCSDGQISDAMYDKYCYMGNIKEML